MNASQFQEFLMYADKRLAGRSDSEKVAAFIAWCKDRGIEEVIARLSAEDKKWWKQSLFLDFTTTRIIVSKKSYARKFLDTGFVAGMAPFTYIVLSKDLKISNIRKQSILRPDEILKSDSANYSMFYSEIRNFFLRKGVETTITNMLGTAIKSNFVTIRTINNKVFSFRLPVSKNGSFEKIRYWLSVVMPIKISTG
jgi:hypothetical protein